MPLTDIAIRSAKPRSKPYKLSDGGGLYLLVTPAGLNPSQRKIRDLLSGGLPRGQVLLDLVRR